MKLLRLLMLGVVAAAVLAPAAMTERSASRPALTARSSSFGKVLFDGRGFVLYAFTRDRRTSRCYGDCAKAWPPYFAPKGSLVVGRGVKRSLLGTVKRRNGRRQVAEPLPAAGVHPCGEHRAPTGAGRAIAAVPVYRSAELPMPAGFQQIEGQVVPPTRAIT